MSDDLGEVFISYSWNESEGHTKAVLALSDRLRSDGIDCVLDQYEVSPPEGWPRWMDRKIDAANLVLVVCSKAYLEGISGSGPDKALGVKWEGGIVYQHLYNQGATNQKFIPVLLNKTDQPFIPVPLQGASRFVVETDSGYERLYNRLLGRAPAERPPLGKRKSMPTREVKTDIVSFVENPIDIPLWDAAEWVATGFAYHPRRIPVLGIAFLNKSPAERIFEEWRRRYGDWDQFDELRVSIIEGRIPNELPGYTVHIGIEHDKVIERYKRAGFEVPNEYFFAYATRLNRMTPSPSSPHLSNFKASLKLRGEYLLAPATCKPDGSDLNIMMHLGIRKRVLHFRNSADVRPNDDDGIVLTTGFQDRPFTEHGKKMQEQEER